MSSSTGQLFCAGLRAILRGNEIDDVLYVIDVDRFMKNADPTSISSISVGQLIAITGVLLALAVPTFRETTMNSQRASRVNELMTDLNYARTQAVSLRQPLTICRSNNSSAALPTCGAGAGWEEGWIVFVDSNNSGTLEAADATQDVNGDGAINGDDAAPLRRKGPLISADQLALTDATKKFTIRGNGLPALGVVTRVTFLASGTSANTGTLVACDSRNDVSKGRAVIVAAGGRVRSTTASGSTCQR